MWGGGRRRRGRKMLGVFATEERCAAKVWFTAQKLQCPQESVRNIEAGFLPKSLSRSVHFN